MCESGACKENTECVWDYGAKSVSRTHYVIQMLTITWEVQQGQNLVGVEGAEGPRGEPGSSHGDRQEDKGTGGWTGSQALRPAAEREAPSGP